MDDGYSDRCRFSHKPYHLMLALTDSQLQYPDENILPLCLPSCNRYQLPWNEGVGCSSLFHWFMYPTPAQCPCREVHRAVQEMGGGMSDDDVIVLKQEEYDNHIHQRQQQEQQLQHAVAEAESEASPGSEAEENESEVAAKEEDSSEEEESEAEDAEEADPEWTAILPVPLHYLCLRTLTTPAFRIFLRAAMGQSTTESGVHVIMHQQPCDARTPLKWGHVILYGTRDEVEKGKRALCAVMDSGYQHTADGRLLVAVVQSLNEEAVWQSRDAERLMLGGGQWHARRAYQAWEAEQSDEPPRRRRRGELVSNGQVYNEEHDDDDDEDNWLTEEDDSSDASPPRDRRRGGPAIHGVDYDGASDEDEKWTTEDEEEFDVPNPHDVVD